LLTQLYARVGMFTQLYARVGNAAHPVVCTRWYATDAWKTIT
jgi:hypothetical protein